MGFGFEGFTATSCFRVWASGFGLMKQGSFFESLHVETSQKPTSWREAIWIRGFRV